MHTSICQNIAIACLAKIQYVCARYEDEPNTRINIYISFVYCIKYSFLTQQEQPKPHSACICCHSIRGMKNNVLYIQSQLKMLPVLINNIPKVIELLNIYMYDTKCMSKNIFI